MGDSQHAGIVQQACSDAVMSTWDQNRKGRFSTHRGIAAMRGGPSQYLYSVPNNVLSECT